MVIKSANNKIKLKEFYIIGFIIGENLYSIKRKEETKYFIFNNFSVFDFHMEENEKSFKNFFLFYYGVLDGYDKAEDLDSIIESDVVLYNGDKYYVDYIGDKKCTIIVFEDFVNHNFENKKEVDKEKLKKIEKVDRENEKLDYWIEDNYKDLMKQYAKDMIFGFDKKTFKRYCEEKYKNRSNS